MTFSSVLILAELFNLSLDKATLKAQSCLVPSPYQMFGEDAGSLWL